MTYWIKISNYNYTGNFSYYNGIHLKWLNQLHNSVSHRNAITLFKANYKSDLHILTVEQKQ